MLIVTRLGIKVIINKCKTTILLVISQEVIVDKLTFLVFLFGADSGQSGSSGSKQSFSW